MRFLLTSYSLLSLSLSLLSHLSPASRMSQWNGGCMVDRLMGGASGKSTKGNVFCAHRQRVPMVTLLLDALSFPMMIRDAQGVRPVVPRGGWRMAGRLSWTISCWPRRTSTSSHFVRNGPHARGCKGWAVGSGQWAAQWVQWVQ